MASTAGSVLLEVSANLDRLKSDVDRAMSQAGEKAARTLSDKLNSAGEKLVSVGSSLSRKVTVPVVAAFTGSVFAANNLSKGLREVITLTGETGEQADATFADFSEKVAGLSRELGVTQNTLVGGLYSALSAGIPRDTVFEFLDIASRAAIAGVTDVETAVDGLTTVINAFGLDPEQASAVSDSLFTAVKGGKTTFQELSDSLFNIAPAAAAASVSFTEVNAAIATLTASGTPTSVATTQLRAALVGLQRPSAELDAIFQSLGFQNAQVAIESEGLGFALTAVRDASGGSNGELQKLLGSVEAVAAANVLAGTGAEKFSSELEAQANAIGATGAAFDEVDKSRELDRLKVSLEGLAISVGGILLPVVEQIVGIVTPWVQKFGELDPKIQTLIVGGLALAAALGPLLTVVGKLILIVIKLPALIGAISGAFSFLAANPVVLVLLAIAGAAFLIYKNWDSIRPVIETVFDAFKKFGAAIYEFFVDTLLPAVQSVWNWIKANWDVILAVLTGPFGLAVLVIRRWGGDILRIVTGAFAAIGRAVASALRFIQRTVDRIFGAIRSTIETIIGAIQRYIAVQIGLIVGAFDGLRSGIETVWAAIGSAIDVATGVIRGIFDGLRSAVETVGGVFESVGSTISDGWSRLRDTVAGAIDFVLGKLGELRDWITSNASSLLGPLGAIVGFVGSVGGRALDLFRANGGPVRAGQPYVVGEAGPEIIFPGRSGMVASTSQIASALASLGGSGGGGDTYNISISNPVAEPASLSVAREQRRLAYLGGR
jgi:TP901 family phage tail tape measure protein